MGPSWSRVKGALAWSAALLALLALWAAADGFQLFGPLSRFLTPNGPYNQRAIFCFDNPSDSGVSGEIYTLLGAQVSSLQLQSPAVSGCPAGFKPQDLYWDGRENGSVVHSGVYVYEIDAEGHHYTGTVVVIR